MKNTFGNALTITLFGESHGAAIGAVLDGLAPGIKIDQNQLHRQMDKRRPKKDGMSTTRTEGDQIEYLSGYYNGVTTGTPLCMCIRNQDTRSGDYRQTENLMRPGHADYTAYAKYLGYQDTRGGGHFSGRLTAPIVAAGAICLQILRAHGITVTTHMQCCAGIADAPFSDDFAMLQQQQRMLDQMDFGVLDERAGAQMKAAILQAAQDGDSVGGILETAVTGLDAGIGEPFFDSVESILSSLMFSIPAIKGIEFGAGFQFTQMLGSAANDPLRMQDGKIVTATNNNGGINGGITNGMPLLFRTAVKPTPSIYQPQQTVDYSNQTDAILQIQGRHDPCIVQRARVVQDSMCAIGLVDLFTQRYGYLWQREGVWNTD